MYASDIGTLKPTEYANRVITGKRTRTKEQENVPTVSYPLWDTTKALLEAHRSSHAD
jgi:hypothetical protein